MAAPLLGLASLLGREYAYTRPTYAEQDAILKLVSPQTYYTNQLINYLTDKFDITSSLPRAQNTIENASRTIYGSENPQDIDIEDEQRQIKEINARASTPEAKARFEDNMRDMEYGTINPVDPQYVGPQTEDSVTFQRNEAMLPSNLNRFPVPPEPIGPNAEDNFNFKYGEDSFPVTVGQLPVQSNFTPEQLERLEEILLGPSFGVGPQLEGSDRPRNSDFSPQGGGYLMPQGAGGDFMPQGGGDFTPQGGGDFMPGGYEKNPFDVEFEDVQQYLRGGVVGRRRA
jgi:hypothetical protein